MLKGLVTFISGLLIIIMLGAGGFMWLVAQPGPLPAAKSIIVAKGSSVSSIARELQEQGVISSSLLFRILARVQAINPKAGEYEFVAELPLTMVIKLLAEGRTITRQLTVPEGLTVVQILNLLNNNPALSGEISEIPAEGSLMPETYNFSYGDDRRELLQRMQKAKADLVAELWPKRVADLPIANLEEALVLASIVEKETGISAERARVAGVFINRLRIKMPLQADPTVLYAVTGGTGELNRPLYRPDLEIDSPYNTYRNQGLPPGPIANSGRAAIEAVLNPEVHEYFYFVADGTGGHAFAKTLEEHNDNVVKWRAIRDAKPAPAAPPTTPAP